MKNRLTGLLLAALISFALAGCQTSPEDILPNRGPSIEEIYMGAGVPEISLKRDAHMKSTGVSIDEQDHACAIEELEKRFRRLVNPTLYMYVYPHLTHHDGNPIPGYLTYFPLYESIEIALPGEPAEPVDRSMACNE